METTTRATLRADLLNLAARKIADALDDEERSENEMIRDYVAAESADGLLRAVRGEAYDLQVAWHKLYTQRRSIPARLAALKK